MRVARRHHGASGGIDFSALSSTQIFLLAQNATQADGVGVDSWTETSNDRHAVQATGARQPILRKSGAHVAPTGKWMVEFDGDNDWLSNGLPAATNIPIAATGLTLFFYYKQISLTNSSAFDAQLLFDCGNGVTVFEFFARSSADLGVGWPDTDIGTNNGNVRDLWGAAQTGYQLLTWEMIPPAGAGAEMKMYRNSVQIGTTQVNWQAPDIRDGYGVGNSIALNTGFRGAVGLVQVVSEVYSAGDRAAIESSMLSFFGT